MGGGKRFCAMAAAIGIWTAGQVQVAASGISLSDATYCERVAPLFDQVLAVKPGELHRFAAERAQGFAAADAAGVAGCPPPATRSAAKKPAPTKASAKQAAPKPATTS